MYIGVQKTNSCLAALALLANWTARFKSLMYAKEGHHACTARSFFVDGFDRDVGIGVHPVSYLASHGQTLKGVAFPLFCIFFSGTWYVCTGKVKAFRKVNSDLPALLDEWAASLFRELDYVREAENGVRFKRLYGDLEVRSKTAQRSKTQFVYMGQTCTSCLTCTGQPAHPCMCILGVGLLKDLSISRHTTGL